MIFPLFILRIALYSPRVKKINPAGALDDPPYRDQGVTDLDRSAPPTSRSATAHAPAARSASGH